MAVVYYSPRGLVRDEQMGAPEAGGSHLNGAPVLPGPGAGTEEKRNALSVPFFL